MAFKKRLPASHNDYDNYEDNQSRSSQNQGGYTSGPKEAIFSDNFELKIDYKSDQVFDFDTYKHKIVNIMEVFREDILNLKSNLMHLFTIVDKQVHKDYHDLTNELVALSQIKLEAAISKSSAYLKNFDEETLSRKILDKLEVDNFRHTIRSSLAHFKEEIESYLTEDKYYRKSTFAISDLALQLEKAFKIYDVLNEEGGIFNYIKVDEIVLYDQIFQNNLEIDFNLLIHLNVPLLKDRLKAENMYRTGAATTKERLMFRIGEISDKDPADYHLSSITSYIKTLLLREKFNLKHNLVNSFQKNLPKGLELQGDSERVRKEIREELDGLKESIAYLESQNKSYIKIITGNYNPEFINAMSHTISNIDILIDIERLFAIIQDITFRIKGLLGKVREFHDIEKRDVSQSVEHSLNLVIEGLSKNAEGKFDLSPIIDEIFSTIDSLIRQEKEGRERFMAEKQKIDAERKELESYVDNLAVNNKESREASAVKPGGSALKFQKEEAWKKEEPPKRDTYQAREEARRNLREEEENKRDTVARENTGFSKTTKSEFEDTKKYEPYSYSTKAAELKKPEPVKKEEPKYEPKKWEPEPKKEEPKKWEAPKKEEPKYEPKKWEPEPIKKEEPKKVEPIKKEEPKKWEPEPIKKEEPKKFEPIKKEEPKKIETKPYSSSWNQPKEQLTPKSPDEIVDAVDEITKQLQDSSTDIRKDQPKITSLSNKPEVKPKSNFWDNEEEDIEDIDVKPTTTATTFKKEEPKKFEPIKKEEPKKEDPKKKNSGFWDNDFEEEDLEDTTPIKSEPINTKKPEPLKPIEKKVEPLSLPKQDPPKPEPKKEEPKKVEKKPAWEEDIMDEFDDIQISSGPRQPSAKDPKSLASPASNQTSAVKDPLGSVFEKLETKKEEPKKEYKGKPKDEDEIDEYIDDFESSSPDKGLESSEKMLESADKFGDKKINPQPIQAFNKKVEDPIKADPQESDKSDDERPAASQPAASAFKWPSVVTEDKLALTNEYIEQEAALFGQPVNPEAFNNTQVLVCLLQEFIAQNKVFIFDFPETEMILNEMGEDPAEFKRNKFPAEVISEVANAMKSYYLEVLPNLSSVLAKGRFYIPFAIDDPSVPNLVEIDFTNKVFCLIYGNPVGNDKTTNSIANEFHALVRDIIAQTLEPADARTLNSFKLVKVGCTPNCEKVLQSVAAQVYLRVMLYVYYLDYEVIRNAHQITIDIDEACLMRFFTTLKSACTLKEVVESEIWPQYAENFVKTSEQLSDGKECLIEHKNYDLKPNEYDKLSNLIGKELGLLFGRLSKGLKEIFLALDVNQGDAKKSVYYIFMTSIPDPQTTTKKYRAIAFLNAENDEEFDNRIEKVMKSIDKANNTDVVIYKDYLRHYLNVQFSDVTLGVWILLVKQNQFSPEEAMSLITYNMNPYHLDLQEEGEEDGGDGYGYGQGGEDGGDGEYYDDGELPIDEIDDNNF